MGDFESLVIELSEKVIWLEKLYNQTLSNINDNISQFWMILFGILGLVGIGLVFIAKEIVKTGVEKGLRDIQKEYDEKFLKQQEIIDSMAIESGTNANGSYIRFPDGTQICTHRLKLSYSNSEQLLNQWVFPASFEKVDNVIISLIGDSVDSLYGRNLIQNDINNGQVKVTLYKGLGNHFKPEDIVEVSLMAIGKWKG